MNTISLRIGDIAPGKYTGKINWYSSYFVGCERFDRAVYYKEGQLHREDGPAVIYTTYRDNRAQWYLDGTCYTKKDWFELLSPEQKLIALFNEENFILLELTD